MAVPVAARLRHAWRSWSVAVAGLALAVAVPVVTSAVGSLTAAAALREGLAALPAGERSVVVSYNGIIDPQQYTRLDALVAAAVPRIASPPIRRQMLYRQITDGAGGGFVLAGTDQLSGAVRVVAGRAPRSCTPTRCEVIALGAQTVQPPADLGLVVVGRAERTDPLLLTGTFDPGVGVPVLVGDGVRAVSALASLSAFGRSAGWVAPLDADRLRATGVEGWVREGAQVAQDLWRDGEGLVVTSPDDALREQGRRATLSGQRFALLGSSMAVLLLGTAVIGGASVRRDHEAFRAALRLRGASDGQTRAATAAEVAAVAVASLVGGLALGGSGAAALAARAGLPVLPTAVHAVGAGLPATAALTLASAGLLAVTLRGRTAWPLVGGASLACALGAVLILVRGQVSTAGGRDPLLTLLPALVLLAASLAVARSWPVLTRLGLRTLPRRAVAARLGVSAAAGRPLRPVATAALLTAAIAAATFAGAYRATLERGAADQAAFAVPLDARLTIGATNRRPQDALEPAQLLAAAGGRADAVVPAVRSVASVRITAEQGDPVQLLGLAPSALPRIARWPAVTGAGSETAPSLLADRIAVPTTALGTALPVGTALHIATEAPVTLAATAHLRTADGRERGVPLRVEVRESAPGLAASLPTLPDVDGTPAQLWLVAISLRLPTDSADHRQHNLGEGRSDRATPTGRIAFGGIDVDGRQVAAPWSGWAAAGARSTGTALAVDYQLYSGVLVLNGRAGGPGSAPAEPLPVIVDPQTAAEAVAGQVTFVLDGGSLPVRVVGTLERFPTTTGRFAVADGAALARVVGARTPGAGQAAEVWLDGVGPTATRGFDQVSVSHRAEVEAGLRADPVARSASALLLGTALAVLGVAALALILLVSGERRDDAARAYAWEADGVAPATLRSALWWRAVAVTVPSAPAGVATGLALSLLAARMVAVTAVATTPQPPLVAATGAGGALLALGAALVLALAGSYLVAATALREPLPVRGGGAP